MATSEQVALVRKRRPDPPLVVRIYQDNRPIIRAVISLLAALVFWELLGRYIVTSKLMFAPFSAVMTAFLHLWGTGELQRHMTVSFTELGLGFVIAAVVGIGVGSAIAMSVKVREHLDPLVNALYATPLIALSPIIILSLGIDIASKVAIVFMLSVFPILVNTTSGITSTDESLIEAARSFGASRLQIFRFVLLPAALPFIIAGFRLGVGRGIVAIFVGELIGAREGIGFMITNSGQVFDLPSMFAGVLILSVAGVISVSIFQLVEKMIAPWRQFELKA